MRSAAPCLVAVALLTAGAASAQGFAPIPRQSGPDAPPESSDYPGPAVPIPQPPAPMPTVNYPTSAGARTGDTPPGTYRPPQPTVPFPVPVVAAPAAPPAGPTPVAPPRAGVQQAGLAPVGPPAPAAPDAWQPRGGAELRALDKVNAHSLTVSGRVGQVVRYATLTIVVRACVVRPPDQAADAAAFLDITDSRPNTPAFHGWMFADEPGLMVYEHPVYDVRLLGCRA